MLPLNTRLTRSLTAQVFLSGTESAARFLQRLLQRNQRMRDSVISIIQRTKIEDFSEPSMNWMRAELIPAVNRILKTSSVRDVVFTEFAIERS